MRVPFSSQPVQMTVIAAVGEVPNDMPAQLVRRTPHPGDEPTRMDRGVVPLAQQRRIVDTARPAISPVHDESCVPSRPRRPTQLDASRQGAHQYLETERPWRTGGQSGEETAGTTSVWPKSSPLNSSGRSLWRASA